MTQKVYVVTDLGPGDGGKGGVVHKLVTMMPVHTVIKRGGAQGSHGVCTSSGQKFNFSQWGCGTFEGIPTHISEQLIVSPEGLLNEAAALRYGHGVYDAFDLLTVDERALCATPFHGIASRIKELARGSNPRGTVGTGVGEAYRSLQRQPELAITAGQLGATDLGDRLAAIREQVRSELAPIVDGSFLAEDMAERDHELKLLANDGFLHHVIEQFEMAAQETRVVNSDYLGEVVLTRPGVAVVESSHGVLTDSQVGFAPHTSAIRTLPRFTSAMLKNAGFNGEIVQLGVTRAYAIRHGAGPLPTDDPALADHLLPGSHKDDNRYQGRVRVGALDFELLRYALKACGGPDSFDGLAITWFDQIVSNGIWRLCQHYQDNLGPPHGVPVLSHLPIDSTRDRDDLFDVCARVIYQSLGVPVRMVSFGPTEQDKICK